MPSLPTVLVTGSSGLIGSRVVQDLARDFRVVGMDLTEREGLPASATFIPCDLTSDSQTEIALATLVETHGNSLASVIHLAAHYDFSGEPSPLYEQLTVQGTRRLLRGLAKLDVQQFVFTSTILVMQQAPVGGLIDEQSPVVGLWDYPQSKLEAEDVIVREHRQIPAVILRLAGAYDEHGHSPPIAHQIARIYESTLESHLYPGDEHRGQPFIHLEDVVAVIRRVIERRTQLVSVRPAIGELDNVEVMLVAEPTLLSYGEIQDQLGQLIHGKHHWRTLRIPRVLAKAGAWIKDKLHGEDQFIKPWMVDLADTHLPISTRHMQERLDWLPSHRLGATLPKMVENLLADPEQFYRDNNLPLGSLRSKPANGPTRIQTQPSEPGGTQAQAAQTEARRERKSRSG